jgi:peptidoglycan/xylan/chitin deacetylase (PgdA/CDA1 family)
MNKTFKTTIIIALLVCSSFAAVNLAEATDKGTLSIVFDDGRIGQYLYAYQLMKARDMQGTFYVISDYVGTTGYMNYAQLNIMEDNDNDIGSHGKTHSYMVGRTEAWLRNEFSASKQALEANGLHPKNFAYPFAEADALANRIALEYYQTARLGYNYPYAMTQPYPQVLLAGAGEANGDSLTRLKSMVDGIKADTWSIFFFHIIGPDIVSGSGKISTSDFTAFLDYVVTKGVNVDTVSEVLSKISAPAPSPTPSPTPFRTSTPTPNPTVAPSVSPTNNPTNTPLPTAEPTQNQANLLANPSLEQGLSGWQTYLTPQMQASFTLTSDAHSGTQAFKITASKSTVTTQQSAILYQKITAQAGEKYCLSCWYKSSVQATILLLAYNGASQVQAVWLNLHDSSSYIQSGVLSLTLPVGTTYVRVDARLFNSVGVGYVVFDDFVLKEVA